MKSVTLFTDLTISSSTDTSAPTLATGGVYTSFDDHISLIGNPYSPFF